MLKNTQTDNFLVAGNEYISETIIYQAFWPIDLKRFIEETYKEMTYNFRNFGLLLKMP